MWNKQRLPGYGLGGRLPCPDDDHFRRRRHRAELVRPAFVTVETDASPRSIAVARGAVYVGTFLGGAYAIGSSDTMATLS
jgi:hypothetical protein